MPSEKDGLGLLEWIRRHRPELPVILTSAYTLQAETITHPSRGERFIPKPAAPFVIAKEIKSFLDQRGKE